MNDQEFARRMQQFERMRKLLELRAIHERQARNDAIALVAFLVGFIALAIAALFIVLAAR